MKYFKKMNGEVWAFESDGSQDHLITDEFTAMTEAEVESHINPPKSAEQVKSEKIYVIQRHLDEAARQYGYDDIKSAVTYADEPAVPAFQDQGKAFRAWRSLVWEKGYELLAAVDGSAEIPTDEALIAALPALDI